MHYLGSSIFVYFMFFIAIYGYFPNYKSSASAIFNINHPVLKSLSSKLYQEGINQLKKPNVDPKPALIQYLTRSYALWPTKESSEGLGDVYSYIEDYSNSIYWYELALKHEPDDIGLIIKIGFDYHKSGLFRNAISIFERGFDIYSQNQNIYNSNSNVLLGALMYHMGLSHSFLGNVQEAAYYFNYSITLAEENTAARINLAAIFQKSGSIDESVYHYDYVIRQVHSSFDPFENQINDYFVMSNSNKIMAFYQVSNFELAWETLDQFVKLLELHFSMCKGTYRLNFGVEMSTQYCDKIAKYYYQMMSHSLVLAIASLNWKSYEHHSALLLSQFRRGNSLILPFDSLLYDFTLQDRFEIALQHSFHKVNYFAKDNVYYHSIAEVKRSLFSSSITKNDVVTISSSEKKPTIRIGLISNDFSDHPTTHLIEGLLVAIIEAGRNGYSSLSNQINQGKVLDQVKIYLYNYGNNDGSLYRRMMEGLAYKFVDLEFSSYSEIADIIKKDQIHILLDMQVHTLGSRLEVMAKQPAPVQLNYLVYPGTSGTPFLGAIAVDRVAVPPEHAQSYSESLMMLPPSYQLSYYDRHINRSQFNSINGRFLDKPRGQMIVNDIAHKISIETIPDALKNIPEESILFCNFNKIDKLEPTTIQVWMNLLIQIPSSYLFLLAPLSILDSKSTNQKYGNFNVFGSIQNQIRRYANYYGVRHNRIIFVRKANKTEHIQRHAVMDLFIDSFGYGAHSTATDALRNGIPLFTMEGGTFPKRVASSLIESISGDIRNSVLPNSYDGSRGDKLINSFLIHYSCKDFENYAERLSKFKKKGSRNAILSSIRRRITSKIDKKVGIFDTSRSAEKLIYGLQGILEGKILDGNELIFNKYYYYNKQGNNGALSRFNESNYNDFHIIVN